MLLIEKNILSEQKKNSLPKSGPGGESENSGSGNESRESGNGKEGSREGTSERQPGLSGNDQKNGDIRETSRSKQSAGRVSGQGEPVSFPKGHDDDIVARQLREAAEKETDPALRKKLWDEYKLYKQGNN